MSLTDYDSRPRYHSRCSPSVIKDDHYHRSHRRSESRRRFNSHERYDTYQKSNSRHRYNSRQGSNSLQGSVAPPQVNTT